MRPDLRDLLSDPMFSDLTLVCESERFKVHRNIVCSQSPVLKAACTGQFQEANSREVEVNVGDASAVTRFIEYLYTGDYNDNASVNEECDSKPAAEIDENGSTTERTSPDPHQEPDKMDSKPEPKEDETSASNDRLIASAKMHILADYYQIPGLQQLAVSKFHSALQGFHASGFAEVVSLVYGSEDLGLAKDLREEVGAAIVEHAAILTQTEAFMAECAKLPVMMAEIMPKIVGHYESQLEKKEQDAVGLGVEMITLHSKLESTAENITKMEKDISHLQQKLNNISRCRHCQAEANVRFRPGELTPRCVCGTRY